MFGQSSSSGLLCSADLTLPSLDASLAPRCTREVGCQHLNGLVLERIGLAIRDEGRSCYFGQNDVYLLVVAAMTIFRNVLTCGHDGIETLNVLFEWLALDVCQWLRCGGCSKIGTRDHNLSSIDHVKKAKRIVHAGSNRLLTIRWLGLHHNFVFRKMITCVCTQLFQTMQRSLPGLIKVGKGHPYIKPRDRQKRFFAITFTARYRLTKCLNTHGFNQT